MLRIDPKRDPAPFDEERITAAIARIVDRHRKTRGTGFLVSSEGTVLTCDHVVADLKILEIQTSDGEFHRGTVAGRFPEVDLALVQCPTATDPPLPLVSTLDIPAPFWSKGFQHSDVGVRAALPVSGTIDGMTRVAYGGKTKYELDVFALSRGDINPGMSGAPLLHPDWGVVVGVVNTDFKRGNVTSGFALPLARAEASAHIARVLASNRLSVPSFGPFLNRRAAVALSSRSLERFVATLERDDEARQDRYCARPGLAAAVKDFLAGSAQVLGIVGRTGVGKTMEMVHIARARGQDEPTLLLVGRSIGRSAENGIAAALEASLAEIAPLALPRQNALGSVVRAFRAEGGSLVVFVDALNEAPAVVGNAKHWMGQTIEWLRETGARLIVTCRPEFWDRVEAFVAPDLLFRSEGSPEAFVRIEDFTVEEAQKALTAYGLDESGLSANDVQHPFLLKIFADMRRRHPGKVGSLSRYEALERFIDLRCEQVATAADLLIEQVRRALSTAARTTLGRVDMLLEPAAFDGLNNRLLPRLVREGLLVPVGEQFRFAFDQVGEFLESAHVPMDKASALIHINRLCRRDEAPGAVRHGTLLFALLRVEANEGSEELSGLLAEMLDVFEREGGIVCDDLFASVFDQSRDARALTGALERYVRASVLRFGPLSVLRRVDLPTGERLRLLRIMAAREFAEDWERKHWDRGRSWGFDEFSMAAAAAITAEPPAAFRELRGWLSDTTPLRNIGEGWANPGPRTVGDVARGLLYRFSDRAFDQLCDLLAEAGHEETLLELLAEQHPERMLLVCERWGRVVGGDRMRLAAFLIRKRLAHSFRIEENQSSRAQNGSGMDFYAAFARLAKQLEAGTDYIVQEEQHAVSLTESGIARARASPLLFFLNFDEDVVTFMRYLDNAVKAKVLYRRDKEYLVKGGDVVIIDEVTGYPVPRRRWDNGLHQAVEAKEGVRIRETHTDAPITIQNYFRVYDELAGLTGSAATKAEDATNAEEATERAIEILRRLLPTDEPQIRLEALCGLMIVPKTRDEVIGEVLQRFRADPAIPAEVVGIALGSHFSSVFPALTAELHDGADSQRKAEILTTLTHYTSASPEELSLIVGELERLWPPPDGTIELALCRAVNELLRRADWVDALTQAGAVGSKAQSIAPRIVELAQGIAATGSDGARGYMLFWSTSKRSRLDRGLQENLFTALLSAADDKQAIELVELVDLLERRGDLAYELPWALDRILARPFADPAGMEWALVVHALRARHLAEALAERLLTGASYHPTHAALEFLQLIQRGTDAQAAAREIVLRDIPRYVAELPDREAHG